MFLCLCLFCLQVLFSALVHTGRRAPRLQPASLPQCFAPSPARGGCCPGLSSCLVPITRGGALALQTEMISSPNLPYFNKYKTEGERVFVCTRSVETVKPFGNQEISTM